MKSKRLIASIAAATMVVGAFGLTGCTSEDGADDAKPTDKATDDTPEKDESSE